MCHINVKSLWLQEKEVQQELSYEKVRGEVNPSDGLTKHVRQELADRYAKVVNLKLSKDRGKRSLQLTGAGEKGWKPRVLRNCVASTTGSTAGVTK